MKVVEILLEYVDQENDRDSKILDFKMPEELEQILDLELPEKGLTLGQLFKDCRTALRWQVKTGHPHFFNQLSSGLDIVSLAGEWLTSACNTNMYVDLVNILRRSVFPAYGSGTKSRSKK